MLRLFLFISAGGGRGTARLTGCLEIKQDRLVAGLR